MLNHFPAELPRFPLLGGGLALGGYGELSLVQCVEILVLDKQTSAHGSELLFPCGWRIQGNSQKAQVFLLAQDIKGLG